MMYPTRNDLPLLRREELVALLNGRLAECIDLQLQCKQAHWNVKGMQFIALHELFDRVHEAAGEYADLLAERAVQLGGTAMGTVRRAAAATTLTEYPGAIADGKAHVEAVAAVLAAVGHRIRRAIDEAVELGDADTGDIFTEVSRGLDKWLWLVEAHAQAGE